MKRLQIRIEEELDEALETEAARRQVSKAALVRGFVIESLRRASAADPVDELVGDKDDEAGDIDGVVYGT